MGAQWKQKGREASANAKGRVFSKIAKDIIIAARSGADPANNAKLRMTLEAARKASMTRDTIDRAIKKGAGLLDGGVQYDSVTYEGFAPHQVAVIVECLTENKNRTSADIRVLFRKGQLGAGGSASWDFTRLGAIEASPPEGGADAEEAAIESGAQDLESDGEGGTVFYSEPTDLDAVSKALAERKWVVSSAKLIWKPKNPVTSLTDAQRTEVEAFLSDLDDNDDVQAVYPALG